MDKTNRYNKTQKGELSESCLEINADHILNAAESSMDREERKGNWEPIFPAFKKKKEIKLSSKSHNISRCSLSV